MYIVHNLQELRTFLSKFNSPAFVPTMGNLHDGHIELIRKAKTLGDVTVASIFVNRLQFLPNEDFESYPRTWDADCAKLEAAGCDLLFAPDESVLYPAPQTYTVHPSPALANILEGEFRPGFFIGVCTVVMKLFACVQPRVAVFGKKDYQQLMIIREMVEQFGLPIRIVSVETVRGPDGLALSSRNGYLSESERSAAVQLSLALKEVAISVRSTKSEISPVSDRVKQNLRDLGWVPDYLTVRLRTNLQYPPVPLVWSDDSLVVLAAARIGSVRLIDNLEF